MNSAASIRARLLNESKKSGESFQSLLVRFASERFLFRLGKSDHKDAFLLKGAMLFVAWGGRPHRPTKDLDLLGFGEPGQEAVARRIADIAALPGEDGIEFDIDSIVTELIKEDAEYEGVRVHVIARLEQARVPLQIDIGFGDAVTPEPVAIQFPTILTRVEAPVLRIYPPEVVVAEKLHAMVVLDIRNSRMKDFYDIWFLARTKSFDLAALIVSIAATFERRRTPVPAALPLHSLPHSSKMPARFSNGPGSFADCNSTRIRPHSPPWARRSRSSSGPCSLHPVQCERGCPAGLGSNPREGCRTWAR